MSDNNNTTAAATTTTSTTSTASTPPPSYCCPNCVDLLATIKKLKYKLYWNEHSTKELTNALTHANMTNQELKCDCHLCLAAQYWDGDYSVETPRKDCRFRPWLFSRMSECGLSIASINENAKKRKHCCNEPSEVFDIDSHIILPDSNYACISYGKTLWEAELESEELKKLDRLFVILKKQ